MPGAAPVVGAGNALGGAIAETFRAVHPPPAPPASGRGEGKAGSANAFPLPAGERVRVRGGGVSLLVAMPRLVPGMA